MKLLVVQLSFRLRIKQLTRVENTKKNILMSCRYMARPFVIGARSSQYIVAFCSQQIRKLPISPKFSAGTATLQNCESSASRLPVPSRL